SAKNSCNATRRNSPVGLGCICFYSLQMRQFVGSFRHSKIVCTIGPASNSPRIIRKLLEAGMNVARLNFSHGTHEEHAKNIANLRSAASAMKKTIAILADLQGPKIRTGVLAGGGPVILRAGQEFTITTAKILGDSTRVNTIFEALPREVKAGDRI